MAVTAVSARPLPYGGAVQFLITCPDGDRVVVLATPASTPPRLADAVAYDPRRKDTPAVRLVHDGLLERRTQARGPVPTWLLLDLLTPCLPDGQAVHYWVGVRDVDGLVGDLLHLVITPGCVMTAQVQLVRDVVMPRLQYHLDRALAQGAFRQRVEVLEQESVAANVDLPVVLVKERVVPNPAAATIGDHAGESVTASGERMQEFRHAHRVTLDILCLTGSIGERARFAQLVHGLLLQDKRYWEAAGLQSVLLQRQDVQHIEPPIGVYWNVDLTMDCEVEFYTTEHQMRAAPGDVLSVRA